MKQLLLILSFFPILSAIGQTINPIVITDQSINIPGVFVVGAWQSQHSNEPYPDYPKMYYAFAEGDEISVNFSTNYGKGTQRIIVSEFQSKSVAYSNNSFQVLNDVRIRIPKTAVYQFDFCKKYIATIKCKIITIRNRSSAPSINVSHSKKNEYEMSITCPDVACSRFNFIEHQIVSNKRKILSMPDLVNVPITISDLIATEEKIVI